MTNNPEIKDAWSNVSRDGRLWMGGGTLLPPGVYDSAEQLSDQQVVELKDKLTFVDGSLRDPKEELCGYIAVKLVSDQTDFTFTYERPDTTFDRSVTMPWDSPQQYAFKVGSLAAHWYRTLSEATSLPDAEWPRGMTPPATFAKALQELEEARREDG